jgi:hypothetical protein
MTFNGNGIPPWWFIVGMVIVALFLLVVAFYA